MSESYELYYWPGLPGRGEYVRLLFVEADHDFTEAALGESGTKKVLAARRGELGGMRPFAPPVLKVGDLVVSQTALICDVLGERLGLAPPDEVGKIAARQLTLSWCDVVSEAHAVHHPVSIKDYYEDQKPEAKRAAEVFRSYRLPMWLDYFESVIARTGSGWHVGDERSYVDLIAFQTLEGLAFMFPKACKRLLPDFPALAALRSKVAKLPRIASYLSSSKRMPFNEHGIFRHYPELDDL